MASLGSLSRTPLVARTFRWHTKAIIRGYGCIVLLLLLEKFAVEIGAGCGDARVLARQVTISPFELFLLFVRLYDSCNRRECPFLHLLPLLLLASIGQILHLVPHFVRVPRRTLFQYALLSRVRIEGIPIACFLDQVFNLVLLRLGQGVLG